MVYKKLKMLYKIIKKRFETIKDNKNLKALYIYIYIYFK